MLLEGRVSKSNIRKSLGAKVARMLYGRENLRGPQIEKLLNLYSLIGPEYINNKYMPFGRKTGYGNYGLRGALDSYKDRVGLNNSLAMDLMRDLSAINGVEIKPENDDKITDMDIRNIGQWGFDKWYPNKYSDQYRNVLNQLTPYPDYNNGVVNLRGRYENTLPNWLKKYSHPLQIDLEY